jgi:hypothetical protein
MPELVSSTLILGTIALVLGILAGPIPTGNGRPAPAPGPRPAAPAIGPGGPPPPAEEACAVVLYLSPAGIAA